MPVASTIALDDWCRTWWERDGIAWAVSTGEHRRYFLRRWIHRYLATVRLRDLGTVKVREWRAPIHKEGASANTVNGAVSILSACLGAAHRDGLIPAKPGSGVRRTPHAATRPRAFTPIQMETIRAAMPESPVFMGESGPLVAPCTRCTRLSGGQV